MARLHITYICLDDRLFHSIGVKLLLEFELPKLMQRVFRT